MLRTGKGLGDPHVSRATCPPRVRVAYQCIASLSYSLSIEFVYIRNYAEPFSYRYRRRATLVELHSSCALTRDTADRVMVPSSSSRPGEVARCMAATSLGQRYTSSTERPSAARCQSCSQPILLVQRRRCTLDRIPGDDFAQHCSGPRGPDTRSGDSTLQVQDVPCVPVKEAGPCGHGTDTQLGPATSGILRTPRR